jgi:uncharacterized repeat protein (TIGR01451 family)
LLKRGPYVCALMALVLVVLAGGALAVASLGPDDPTYVPGTPFPKLNEAQEQQLLERDKEFVADRTAGDNPLDIAYAGQLRAKSAKAAKDLSKSPPSPTGPSTFTGAWSPVGQQPIGEITRSSFSLAAMNGRIGALAIRPSSGQLILGGAQGGIWTYDAGTGQWTPRTDDQQTQAIGSLAVAPSDDNVVYAGTGEGALSGDSYFGNGILKSTDGGQTWSSVSGDAFQGVSIPRVVVDPANADHLYAATLRGRGGARRTSPTVHSRFGIWESKDGGATWSLIREADEAHGATDIEIDPQNPKVLYASFLSDAIYKSTDGGATWAKLDNFGLTGASFSGTRFSVSISHPNAGGDGVLYTGFDYTDAGGNHQPSRVWKSTDGGASWTELPDGGDGPQGEADAVGDYCGEQCTYDNVIEADPRNPDVVFAGGMFGYDLSPQSGGIFRSDDGGQTWKNLGWDQHPDFHALTFDASKPGHVVVGSDGGVWQSDTLGGRPDQATPLSDNDWHSLNGGGLTLGQYSSIATNPTLQARLWGGTQDNGTQRRASETNNTWYDMTSGDGGQVLVDPTDYHFVYGTYYGISPYRITDGGGSFFTNQGISRGINLADRSEFYAPWAMNKLNPSQLFYGTQRVYRTDNAKATAAGDVRWTPISGDLTTGCTGAAPNGARGCVVSAIAVGGGDAVWAGTLDGLVHVSRDAQVSATPTWTRVDGKGKVLPNRPVASIAVDRSNYRVAYVGYNGFDAATPKTPGHVFKTTDGGKSWSNITSNLPDTPVNSVVLDPSYDGTLYAATDVGTFVTYDGGAHWGPLGTGLPRIGVWQIDLDPAHRVIAAGTHGRGAYRVTDTTKAPALVLTKAAADVPVGPGSDLKYTITLRNIGNADATGVTITDKAPDGTAFASADNGGGVSSGAVRWTGLTVPAGASTKVSFTVTIAPSLATGTTSIVNDGYKATSAEGPSASGSPVITPIAPANAVALSPATQTNGARGGQTVDYPVTLANKGYKADSYAVTVSGTFTGEVRDATCAAPLTTTPSVGAGESTKVCVRITVPAGAANELTDTSTVKATSVGDPSVSATATVKTIAVAVDTLLVDQDTNAPVDSQPYYKDALTGAGAAFSTWDLAKDGDLPLTYLKAFKNVVWFTGNSYPGPLLPYESELTSFLDGGGRLLLSGQDILDQAAGTTQFVHDYLHVAWDGSETQNDKGTGTVTGVTGTLADGVGAVPLHHEVLQAQYEDQITPTAGASGIFTDETGKTDALSFAGTSYKVAFLAFPLEAYGSAAQKADLMKRVLGFFGS